MSNTYTFQAETQQLLDILIHSLYTEREIFLRELVSNASDALNRMQFQQLTESDILDADAELDIHITWDEDAKTLTVTDTGIGMTSEEMVANLGTIAKSGAKNFLEALKDAIRTTGVLPKVFQCDRGGGFRMLKRFCEEHGMIFFPTTAGLSRGKVAENFINRFSAILKERPAYSGQNLTARGENSQLSLEQYKEAQRQAQPYELASHWFKTIGRDKWNDRKIKTISDKPMNKSPNQIYAEKECRGIALDEIQKTMLIGHCHKKRLTTEGLEIKNNHIAYTYFPNLFTEDGRDRGATLYLNTPLNNHPTKGKLTLYVENYGAEFAYIFDKPIEKGGVYQDTWKLKDEVSYVAAINNDMKLLKIYRDFQKMIKELAREQKEGDDSVYNTEVEDSVARQEKIATRGGKQPKRIIVNPLEKEHQQAFMEEEKKTQDETIWIKDRITGEMKEVPLDNEQLIDNHD